MDFPQLSAISRSELIMNWRISLTTELLFVVLVILDTVVVKMFMVSIFYV